MNKLLTHIIILFLLSATLNVKAQYKTPPVLRDSAEFSLNWNIYSASNGISNEFFQAALQAEYLDQGIKDRALKGLKPDGNIAGYVNQISIGITQPLRDSSWFYSVVFGHDQLQEVSFSRTAFQLAFYGNENSIGQEMPFSIYYRSLSTQTLQMGLHYKQGKHGIGMAIGAVSGSRFFEADIPQASITTATDLSEISLNGDIRMSWDDSSNHHNIWKGRGFNADIYYSWNCRQREFFLMLDDFGMIWFPDNHIADRTDSSWTFNGVEANLFDTDKALLSVNRDSLQQWTGLNKGGSRRFMLPSVLRMGFRQYLRDRRFSLGVHAQYYFYSQAMPSVSILPAWQINSQWQLQASLSNGRYGEWSSGLHLRAAFDSGFGLKLGSHNLGGMWIAGSPAALDFYVTLYKH